MCGSVGPVGVGVWACGRVGVWVEYGGAAGLGLGLRGCTSCSAPSRLELLVHALSGESTCTSTGERNVSNHPRCLHGTASATAGSMGCVLEVERELLCPPVELPSPRASVHTSLHTLARKVPRGERFAGDHVYGLLQRMGGGQKTKM